MSSESSKPKTRSQTPKTISEITDLTTSTDDVVAASIDLNATTEAGKLLHAVPIMGDIIRGFTSLYEAYIAYSNPSTPQRKTKLAAALFGGIVSIGVAVVGGLLLGSVGLLATSTAAFAAPITLAAIAVGVCAVALYRDGYVLHQIRKQIATVEAELTILTDEAAQSRKITLLHSLTILHRQRDIAQKKVVLSVISCIALSLALAAVCATGIGAGILAAVGCSILVASAVGKMYVGYQAKKQRMTASITPQAKPTHTHEPSSELRIDRVLLHNKEEDIVKVLKDPVPPLSTEPPVQRTTAPSVSKSSSVTAKTSAKQNEKEEDEDEGEKKGPLLR